MKAVLFEFNFLLCIFVLFSTLSSLATGRNATEIIKNENEEECFVDILNRIVPKKYDKDSRPLLKNATFNIEASVHIYDLNRVMFSDFLEIYVTLKLTQSWTEPRLKSFTDLKSGHLSPFGSLVVPKAHQDRFWKPDTGFGLDEEFKSIFELLEVYPNRTVNYEMFISTKVYCPVEYTLFPMDQPNCTLSFGSNSDLTLRYSWKQDTAFSLKYDWGILLPGVTVLGYTRRARFFDSYHCLLVDIFLKRRFFFYLTRFYLPAFFVVVIAFLPLYLSPDSHSRVGLGVTSVLTMTMLLSSASSDLPNIGQLTFLDVYLFFCFFAVFLSVVEYALIGYYDLIRSKEIAQEAELSKKEDKLLRKIELAEKRSTSVDLLSRQLFPASFALFNVVYLVVCIGILIYNDQVFVEYKV